MKTKNTANPRPASRTPTHEQRKPAYPAHIITMIYNPLAASKTHDAPTDTDVRPFRVPMKLALDRTFIQTLNRIQAKRLAVDYPDNFYLHFTRDVLRLKRPLGRPEVMTLPRLARLLAHDNTKLLAWCWCYAVHWVFVTDTMLARCASDFTDPGGLSIKGDDDQRVPVYTGITFDPRVEGLFVFEDQVIQLLFNPVHLGQHWLIADLVDLAVHECTHCIVHGHNAQFIQIESQLRKELRRLVEPQALLDEARDRLSLFK